MNNEKSFLNDYNEEEHFMALNSQNVYVSHTGDYKQNPIYHVHNSCELLFFEEGKAEYRIDNVLYQAGKNDVLIIGGTDPHSRKFKQFPCIRYGLTVLPAFMQNLPIINGYMNVYRTQPPRDALKLKGVEEGVFRRMIQIICQLHEETRENEAGRGDMVYALLLEMTILLKRLLNLEKQEISGTYKVMSEIKTYIDLQYMRDLSLNELSRQFYLQPNTISKNFSRMLGKNINRYINSVRVTNAVRILEESEVSITELSEMVGYTSVNTFLRQFRDRMGVSPLQYKKRFQEYLENIDRKTVFEKMSGKP